MEDLRLVDWDELHNQVHTCHKVQLKYIIIIYYFPYFFFFWGGYPRAPPLLLNETPVAIHVVVYVQAPL